MYKIHFLLIILIALSACKKDETQDLDNQNNNNSDFFSEYDTKNFDMGFTSWPYAPSIESADNTYNFINENADIYCEHIDNNIPWNSWINDLPLPIEFTNDINARKSRGLLKFKNAISQRYFFPDPGKVVKIKVPHWVKNDKRIIMCEIRVSVGDIVPETLHHPSRAGVVICTDSSLEKAKKMGFHFFQGYFFC